MPSAKGWCRRQSEHLTHNVARVYFRETIVVFIIVRAFMPFLPQDSRRDTTSLALKWPFPLRSRRNRRSSPVCLRDPGPKFIFVPPHRTNANITNLRKFVTYKIWVQAYNSIGESPRSASLRVTTLPDSKLLLLLFQVFPREHFKKFILHR